MLRKNGRASPRGSDNVQLCKPADSDAHQPRPSPPRAGDQLRDRERIGRTVERFIPAIVLFPDRHPAPAALHDFFMFRSQ